MFVAVSDRGDTARCATLPTLVRHAEQTADAEFLIFREDPEEPDVWHQLGPIRRTRRWRTQYKPLTYVSTPKRR